MNRREFLLGASAAAAMIGLPAPALFVDVPGTDLAIVGEPWMIEGWGQIFKFGRDSMPDDFVRRLTVAPWEYIVSPNYKGDDVAAHMPTLEKWIAGR